MMLSCKEVANRASALIDGELGVVERLQLQLHLALCKGCAAFIGQMRTTRDLMQSVALAEEPPDAFSNDRISEILSRCRGETTRGQ